MEDTDRTIVIIMKLCTSHRIVLCSVDALVMWLHDVSLRFVDHNVSF